MVYSIVILVEFRITDENHIKYFTNYSCFPHRYILDAKNLIKKNVIIYCLLCCHDMAWHIMATLHFIHQHHTVEHFGTLIYPLRIVSNLYVV